MPSSRHRSITSTTLIAALTIAALTTATACARSAGPDAQAGDGTTIEITHTFGTSTVPSDPQRIAVTGPPDADIVLALGMTPVAVAPWRLEWSSGVGPWAEPLLDGARPAVVNPLPIDLEEIAATDPDVIIASASRLDESEYHSLDRIAPTVAAPVGHDAWQVPWDVEARHVGHALGRSADAENLITTTERRFDEEYSSHPRWRDRTAVALTYFGGQFGIFSSSDNRGQFLQHMGFAMPTELEHLAGEEFFMPISEENLQILDAADLVVVLAGDSAAQSAFDQSPTFHNLAAVRERRAPTVTDMDTVTAMSACTPLSIPYALERLVSLIESSFPASN